MAAPFRKAAAAVALFLALGVAACFRVPGDYRIVQELENASHAPVFGAAALVILRLVRQGSRATPRENLIAFGGSVLLGAGVEVLQWAGGRDAEALDVAADAAGAASFLLALSGLGRRDPGRWGFLLLSAVVLLPVFAPPALTAAALVRRWSCFPEIATFESRLEKRLCSAGENGPTVVAAAGGHEARIRFEPQLYSGWAIEGPFPDWRRYSAFAFTVRSESAGPIDLHVRIHDTTHNNAFSDRFNAVVKVGPGTTRVRLPLEEVEGAPRGRRMDLSRVRIIGMFVVQPPAPFVLFFDDIRLE